MTKTQRAYSLILLDETSSTNEYASNLLKNQVVENFTTVSAFWQSMGKGQKGSSWESEAGKNLTFTIVTHPEFLPVSRHFMLSIIVSLAVTDFLSKETVDFRIKWPNDLYHKKNKIGGILIENSISGAYFRDSLAGIGLNLNQLVFRSDAPNPVSLRMLTAREYNREDCLDKIVKYYINRFEELRHEKFHQLQETYYSRLLGYEEFLLYEAKGKKFEARITEVKETGELGLTTREGVKSFFDFKEVRLLL